MAEQKTFLVKLKRVTYAEVRVRSDSAKAARQQVEDDGPHEWFVTAEIGGTDTTTIVAVKPEKTA